MAQSFDPTDLSLSGAADMVAIRVQLGVAAHPVMTKEAGVVDDLLAKVKGMSNPLANFDISNPAHAAMLGGGVGVGGGLLATIISKRKKKRWLRNMLMGGALGAGVGGAGSYMAKKLDGMWDTETTKLTGRAKVIEAILGKMRSGETPATPGQLDALVKELADIKGEIDPPTVDSPDAVGRMRTLGLNLGEGDLAGAAKNMWGWGVHDATNKPVNALTSIAAGTAAGYGLDRLRAARYGRSQKGKYEAERTAPVSAKEIQRHEARMTKPVTAHEIRDTKVRGSLPKSVADQIGASDVVRRPSPGKSPVQKFGTPPQSPSRVPGFGTLPQSASSFPGKPPPVTGNKDIFKGVDLRPHMQQLQSDAERVRREHSTKLQTARPTQTGLGGRTILAKPPGPKLRHIGKFTGGALGAVASLFSDWGRNPAEAPRSSR